MTRLFLFLFCGFCIYLYKPINLYIKGGKRPLLSLDSRVPFVPIFIYPYLFGYFGWMIIIYIGIFTMPLVWVGQLVMGTLILVTVSYSIFLIYPTYVTCTYPKGEGVAYRLLQYVHQTDKQNNAFPSMHVSMTTLLLGQSWSTSPALNMILIGLALSIIAATVLLKRHYLLDIVGGLAVGIMSLIIPQYVSFPF